VPVIRRAPWAIVPAKAPARGKSRLRGVLTDEERARFARRLLEHTLDVLGACPRLAGVLVATDGDEVADLARARGACVRRDSGEGTLAEVVDGALGDVAGRGADAAVVLMADLPYATADDVSSVLDALEDHDVVLVRDHLGRHTNALALAPSTAMRTRFGHPDSFAEHVAAARAAGLRVAVVPSEGIAFDVDGPADHAALAIRMRARAGGT
jgi:2-phospho-L-lactate/phosphoenolpyruvate guanylyltransferase